MSSAMGLRRRSGRHGLAGVEPLERRRLLAGYLLGDYLPTAPGSTWEYEGTQDGGAATAARTSHADTTSGATLRFDDTFNAASGFGFINTFLSTGANGAFLHRQAGSISIAGIGDLGDADLQFKTPLPLLNPSIQVGDVLNWTKVPVFATVQVPGVGIVNATGTDTGSSRVEGIERVNLGNGLIAPAALKVVLDHSESYSTRVLGRRVRVEGTLVETFWLAQGIGVVRMATTVSGTVTVSGQAQFEETGFDMVLTDSSLLPDIDATVDADGVLWLNGTSGNDVLGVSRSGDQILAGVNGVAEAFSADSITAIQVHGGDGNDRINFGNGLGPVYALGGNGNDTLIGGDGSDTLTGAAGKDSIVGNLGDDVLNGGKHNDVVQGVEGNDRVYGSDGHDLLECGVGADRCYGGTGDDTIFGGNHNDTIYGDEGNDSIDSGNHSDRIFPGPGSDTVFCGAGDDGVWDRDSFIDRLDGGLGTDSVEGDANDLLNLIETVLP